MLEKVAVSSNDSHFTDDRMKRGKEVMMTVVFHQDINEHLFDFASTAVKYE